MSNDIEGNLPRILQQLHTGFLTDTQHLSQELKKLITVQQEHIVAFINNQIFSEQFNLLLYLKVAFRDREKQTEDIRKTIYEFCASYIKEKNDQLLAYLKPLFQTFYNLFYEQKSVKTQEYALRPITELVNGISHEDLLIEVVKPSQTYHQLSEQLKMNLKPTIKGVVLQVLGHLQYRFASLLPSNKKKMIQEVCLDQLKKAVQKDQNLCLMSSILNSFSKSLHQNFLSEDKLNDLFEHARVLVTPLKSTHDVPKSALDLLRVQCTLFSSRIMNKAIEILNDCFGLIGHKNKELKFTVLDTITVLIQQITNVVALDLSNNKYVAIYSEILKRTWNILEDQTQWSSGELKDQARNRYAGSLITMVKILAILSPLILKIQGKVVFRGFFTKLLRICNRKMIKAFDEESRKNSSNKFTYLKIILYNQKQLISFIASFAGIVQQLDEVSEEEAVRLEQLFSLAVKQYPLFLQKYLPNLTEAMVHFIMGIASKDSVSGKWMKKITLSGLMQSLDTKKFQVENDRDYYRMIEMAAEMWTNLLTHRVWRGVVLGDFSRIYFETMEQLMISLDISYKSKMEEADPDEEDLKNQRDDLVGIFFLSDQDIHINNLPDYQYMCSLAQVFYELMLKIDTSYYDQRVGPFYLEIVHRMRLFPKSIPLMKIVRALNHFIIRTKWLENRPGKQSQECLYCMRTLFREMNENVFKFQQQYFYQCLKLLLSLPNQLYLFKKSEIMNYDLGKILIKSLELGQQIVSLAYTAISRLSSLFEVDKGKAQLYLSKVVPHLEQYVTNKDKKDKEQLRTYLLISQLKITRQLAAQKVLQFLGSVGGTSHLFVDNKTNNHVASDYHSRVDFPITMAGQNYSINLSRLLGRVCRLMIDGKDRTKQVACQFLHAAFTYVLGRTADITEKAVSISMQRKKILSGVLDQVLPTMLQVAANTAHPSQQLIHSLLIQSIHFLANTHEPNSPDIQVLLQHIMELYKGAQDLSYLASKCLSQLVKYHIKQIQVGKKTTYPLVKVTFRSLRSLVMNKKARMGLIGLLRRLLKIVHMQEKLLATYALEFIELFLALAKSDKPAEHSFLYLIGKHHIALRSSIKQLIIPTENRKYNQFTVLSDVLQVIYDQILFSKHAQQREIGFLIWERILNDYGNLLIWKNDTSQPVEGQYIPWFLKERVNRQKKYLFGNVRPISINHQSNQPAVQLERILPRISAQSQMWVRLSNRGYFHCSKLIKFHDFTEVYLSSYSLFVNYMCNTFLYFEPGARILTENVQRLLIEGISSFFKVLHEFQQVKLEVIDMLRDMLNSQRNINHKFKTQQDAFVDMVITFMIHPTSLVPNFNFDSHHNQHFEMFINYLRGARGDIQVIRQTQRVVREKMQCDWSNLINLLFLDNNKLYQQAIKNILTTIAKLHEIIVQNGEGTQEIEVMLTQGIDMLENPKIQLTNHKKQMLLCFLLQHDNSKLIRNYLFNNIQSHSELYQKHEKVWVKHLKKDWNILGGDLVKIAKETPQLIRLLFSLNKILEGDKLKNLFSLVKKNIRYQQENYLEDCLKLQYVLLEQFPIQEQDFDYKSYLSKIIIIGLDQTRNNFAMHEKAMYLAALILNKAPNYNELRKNLRTKLDALGNVYVPQMNIARLQRSEERIKFTGFLKALRNVVLISKEFKLVQFFFPLFKLGLHDSYNQMCKAMVEQCVKSAFTNQDIDTQRGLLAWMFDRFYDRTWDEGRWKNFRVIIVEKVLRKALQQAHNFLVTQFFHQESKNLKKYLDEPFQGLVHENLLNVQIKRGACIILQIFYANLPRKDQDTTGVHKDELYKQLITRFTNLDKVNVVQQFEKHDKTSPADQKAVHVYRKFMAVAYNCMAVILISTQSREEVFKKYAFETPKWERIFDPNKTDFGFEIEPNFGYMQPITTINKSTSKQICRRYNQEDLFSVVQEYIPNTLKGEEELEVEQKPSHQDQERKKKQLDKPLQLDHINKHPCMINMLRIIDHLHLTFYSGAEPIWMKPIFLKLSEESCPLSIRIYLTKLILNRPEVFRQHQMWGPVLLEYLLLKENGGKFIHYYYRDVAKQLIKYMDQGFNIQKPKQLQQIIMKLVKALPDENNIVFSDNIDLLQRFLSISNASILKNTVTKMLMQGQKENKEKWREWRLTALIVIKLSMMKNVPALENDQHFNNNLLFYHELGKKPAYLLLVNEILTDTSKKYRIAAAGFIGELLRFISSSGVDNSEKSALIQRVIEKLVTINSQTNRSAQQKFPLAVYHISLRFPQILNTEIFHQLNTGLVQNRRQRAQILLCFIRYCQYMEELRDIGKIQDLFMTIRGRVSTMLSQELQIHQNFIRLIFQCSKHIYLQRTQITNTLNYIFADLQRYYSRSQDETSSFHYYKTLISLYDFLNDADTVKTDMTSQLAKKVQKGLIKGLGSEFPSVKTAVFQVFENPSKQYVHTGERLIEILTEVYDEDSQQLWVINVVPLIFSLAKKSSDYNRLLFDKELGFLAQFYDWDFRHNLKFQHSSQPYTPQFTQLGTIAKGIDPSMMPSFSGNRAQGVLRASQYQYSSQEQQIFTILSSQSDIYGGSQVDGSQMNNSLQMGYKADSDAESVSARINEIFQNTKKKRNKNFESFRQQNASQQTSSIDAVDNKLRFKKKYDRSVGQRKGLNASKAPGVEKAGLLRKYKVGELPDIKITSKDIIDPLVYLGNHDHQFASQLFIMMFSSICRTSAHQMIMAEDSLRNTVQALKSLKRKFKDIIITLLKGSKSYEYNFISTLQKSLICLCQTEQKMDFSMKEIAFRSNTFDEAIVYTEENLIQTLKRPDIHNQEEWEKAKARQWGDLIDLYHHQNQQDLMYGILLRVAQTEERNFLIRGLELKKDGKIQDAKKQFQDILAFSQNLSIRKFIERQKIDCQTLLTRWDSVSQELSKKLDDSPKSLTIDEQRLLSVSLQNIPEDTARQIIQKVEFSQTKCQYEQAVVSLLGFHDVDKARYFSTMAMRVFSTEWSRISSFALHSKHDLLQILQKTYQLKEFLCLYVKTPSQVQQYNCCEVFGKWSHREPNYMHDSNLTWLQILESRLMFGKMLSHKFGVAQKTLAKYNTDWEIQVANGMVHKGALGGAEQLIKKALYYKKKNPVFVWQFYQSIAKLKLKQLTLQENTKIGKYEIVLNLIQKEMAKEERETRISQFNKNKFVFVENQFYEGYMTSCLRKQDQLDIGTFVEKVEYTYRNYQTLVKNVDKIFNQNSENQQTVEQFRVKLFMNFTNFLDRILSSIEGKFEVKPLKQQMTRRNFTPQKLIHVFFNSLIDSIGYSNLSKEKVFTDLQNQNLLTMIMKLIKVVQRNSSIIGTNFQEAIFEKRIPSWIFIYFIPLMISRLNSSELALYFEDLFENLMNMYPQALIYHFNCSYERREQCLTPLCQRLWDFLHKKLEVNFKFIDNIQLLHHPELRLKQILQKIQVPGEAQNVINELQDFIAPNVHLGKYNKKFIADWTERIKKTINQKKINDFHQKDLETILKNFDEKQDPNKPKGNFSKISDGSTFFEEYNSSEDARLEVLGANYRNFQEPLVWRKVYIESFDHSLLTLSSIHKPKRITIYGSNEKKYMFLVKGGEDVRLDQRIQELFGLINRIMKNDCECYKKQLQIKRFQVIPLKKSLGVFEWVDQTQTLRQFIQSELKQIDRNSNLKDRNGALQSRRNYLDQICPDFKQDRARTMQHKALLNRPQKQVILKMRQCQNQIPYGLLRKALERLSKNYDSYLHVKNKFLSNYAVACLVSYILGIGDRHLQNFLIHSQSASVILIDFGYSFGSSIDLKIPELVPFRLTKIFKELADPIGFEGLFKRSLLACFQALTEKVPLIVDYCEVFIDDPLMEWVLISKKKLSNQYNLPQPSNITFSISQEPPEKIFFSKKVQYVHRKLTGENPRLILQESLSNTIHKQAIYFETLKKAIRGQHNLKNKKLTSEDFVDTLISLSTDRNILGRAYTGWAPFV